MSDSSASGLQLYIVTKANPVAQSKPRKEGSGNANLLGHSKPLVYLSEDKVDSKKSMLQADSVGFVNAMNFGPSKAMKKRADSCSLSQASKRGSKESFEALTKTGTSHQRRDGDLKLPSKQSSIPRFVPTRYARNGYRCSLKLPNTFSRRSVAMANANALSLYSSVDSRSRGKLKLSSGTTSYSHSAQLQRTSSNPSSSGEDDSGVNAIVTSIGGDVEHITECANAWSLICFIISSSYTGKYEPTALS